MVIALTYLQYTELISSFFGIIVGKPNNSHCIKLNFLLLADSFADSGKPMSDVKKRIGELILIFDENLEFVDENWLIDVKSPFVVAKRADAEIGTYVKPTQLA